VVAVIDSGITARIRSDGWLANVPRLAVEIDPLDALPQNGSLDTLAGHGVFVAGIIAQLAPWADIRVYRAAGTDGISTDTDVADTIERAAADGARLFNLSLGCQTETGHVPPAMASAVDTIRQRYGRGVAFVAAAGNFADTREVFPAALPGVVSVASVTAQTQPSPWSSHGPWITCAAIGEGRRSTYVTMDYLTKPPPAVPEPWGIWSGTSFAAAQVTGAVARACYEKDRLPQDAVDALLATGTPTPDWGRVLPVPLPVP
jgi:hypothetical protein